MSIYYFYQETAERSFSRNYNEAQMWLETEDAAKNLTAILIGGSRNTSWNICWGLGRPPKMSWSKLPCLGVSLEEGLDPHPVHTFHSQILLQSPIIHLVQMEEIKLLRIQELGHHLFPRLSMASGSCWGICFTAFCVSLPPAGGTWLPWVEMVKSCLQMPTSNGQSLTLFLGNWNAASLGVSILNIRGISSRKGWQPREKLRMPWGSWCTPERALICHVWVTDYVSWLVVFSFNFLTCTMGTLDLSSYS